MPKLYHGWYVVGLSMLIGMLIVGTIFSSFGLFVVPVSAEFHLSRADMNTGVIIRSIGAAALSPFVGRLLDLVPTRYMMIVGAICFGLSLVGLGLSHSILLDALIIAFPLAWGMLAAGTLTLPTLIVKWFRQYRGRAMALSVVGMSVGGVVVPPIIATLISNFGWRTALIYTGLAFGLALVLIALAIRENPRLDEHESKSAAAQSLTVNSGQDPGAAKLTMRIALSMPEFWIIGFGSGLLMSMSPAIIISLVPLALGSHFSMIQATALVSVISAAAIGGKLLLVVFGDSVDSAVMLAGAATLSVIPYVGFLIGGSYEILLVSALLSGLISGICAPALYTLLANRFGTAAFGTIRGLMAPFSAIIGAIVIRFAGEAYDRTGSYWPMFAAFIGITITAAILLLISARYPRRVPG